MYISIKDEYNVMLSSSVFEVEDGIGPSYCKSERLQDQEIDKWHVPIKSKAK